MPNLHLSRRIQHALTGLILLVVSHILSPFPTGFILLSLATAAFYHVHRKRTYDEDWDQWYLEQFGPLLREHEKGEWEGVNVADNNGSTSNTQTNRDDAPPTTYKKRRRRKTIPALPGAYYFLVGTALSTLFFSTKVARNSLLVLSIADPMAGLVGVWFTKTLGCNITWKRLFRIGDGGPSLAGSIACAITTIFCTYVYITSTDDTSIISGDGNSVSLSLASRCCVGIVAALAEALGGRNFPLIGAVVDDNLLIPLAVGCMVEWLGE